VGVRLVQSWWQKVTSDQPVSKAAQQLYELVDGDRSVLDLQRLAEAEGLPAPAVTAALEELVDAGAITATLEMPLGIAEPMDFLFDTLVCAGAAPTEAGTQRRARTVAQLAELVALKDRFDRGAVDERFTLLDQIGERFTSITANAATRGAGQLYADRSVLYEDATREFSQCLLGADVVGELRRYGPLWDLLWLPTERDHELTNAATADWFRRRFDGAAEVPFLDYARAWVDDRPYLTEMLQACARELVPSNERLLRDLCRGQRDAEAVQLTLEEVAAILHRHGGAGRGGVVLNPDVLLAADSQHAVRRGDYQLVLGEIHSDRDLLSHGLFAAFLRGADRDLVAEFATTGYRLAGEDVVAEVVRTHERKTNVQLELDLPSVEMQHRGRGDRGLLVTAADLTVCLADGRLRLRDARNDRFLLLTVARVPVGSDERSSPLRPFAFARRDYVLPIPAETDYFPRIVVERMVVQRRLWRSTPADWGPEPTAAGWSAEHFRWLRTGARQAGIPAQAFAKVAGERKGTYVDFDSYLLARALLRIWKRNPGPVTFTELFPERHQWWLRDGRGSYSCEFRLGMFRADAHHPPGPLDAR
ncbi:MAG TPA: lantibiotic dehydratase, partial [Jatrophihabitans sp.]|nr:lantibiotic dehydratase [Jatrophihabitans sp.]